MNEAAVESSAKGRSLTEMCRMVEEQADKKMDFVLDTTSMDVGLNANDELELIARAEFPGVETPEPSFPIRPLAHGQIGESCGIPKRYYDTMLAEAPMLLRENVAHWFREKPKRRMVRTMDGDARAFLSDRYQRRDNVDLLRYVLPVLFPDTSVSPWYPQAQEVTERRMYLKLVNTQLTGVVKTERAVDDVVYGGIVVSNSEVGMGTTRVEPMIWWKWCTNGAVMTKYSHRKVHLGKQLEEGVQAMLTDEALQAADKAYFLMVRDALAHFTKQEVFVKIVQEIQTTATRAVTGKVEKGVEILGKACGLTSGETEGVLKRFYENSPRYGFTQYGLLNAVTNLAQEAPSFDRATELEEAAQVIVDLPKSQWRSIAEAA